MHISAHTYIHTHVCEYVCVCMCVCHYESKENSYWSYIIVLLQLCEGRYNCKLMYSTTIRT